MADLEFGSYIVGRATTSSVGPNSYFPFRDGNDGTVKKVVLESSKWTGSTDISRLGNVTIEGNLNTIGSFSLLPNDYGTTPYSLYIDYNTGLVSYGEAGWVVSGSTYLQDNVEINGNSNSILFNVDNLILSGSVTSFKGAAYSKSGSVNFQNDAGIINIDSYKIVGDEQSKIDIGKIYISEGSTSNRSSLTGSFIRNRVELGSGVYLIMGDVNEGDVVAIKQTSQSVGLIYQSSQTYQIAAINNVDGQENNLVGQFGGVNVISSSNVILNTRNRNRLILSTHPSGCQVRFLESGSHFYSKGDTWNIATLTSAAITISGSNSDFGNGVSPFVLTGRVSSSAINVPLNIVCYDIDPSHSFFSY